MQGDGSFSTHSANTPPPIKLSLASTCGRVNLIARFGGHEICIASFRQGMYHPQPISKEVAEEMGICLDFSGHILNASLNHAQSDLL